MNGSEAYLLSRIEDQGRVMHRMLVVSRLT